MRTVCLIPARGGSVRIPRKNIKLFHGKPIIEYSIETAKASRLFDDIIVSTDDDEIQRVAAAAGVATVMRLERDDGTKGTQEVAADVLREWPWPSALACVLYATAPLLTWKDLAYGWRTLLRHNWAEYAHSVDAYCNDIGGYYWGFAAAFVEGVSLEGHSLKCEVPSARCCDINTMDDWNRAEEMYAALNR